MALSDVRRRLARGRFRSLAAFAADLNLIFENAKCAPNPPPSSLPFPIRIPVPYPPPPSSSALRVHPLEPCLPLEP